MKLYLVRHAQSKRNIRLRSDEDSELTEVGQEQSRRLGKYFHQKKIDLVYCSKLRRAHDTFKEISPFLPDVKVVYTDKITEYKMGIFGRNGFDDWESFFKAVGERKSDLYQFRPEGGESFSEMYRRAGEFYKSLLKKHSKKDILVVGHGFFLRFLLLNAWGLAIEEEKYFSLSNASVSTLMIEKNKIENFHINDYHHLIYGGIKLKELRKK